MTTGSVELSMDILTFASNNSAAIASAMVDLDANKVASRAWGTMYAAVTNVLNWGDLGWCGTNVGAKNKFATNLVVTDYWPPDEQITNLINIQAESCRLFGLARLYKGCIIHDYCYSVPGKTKASCDDEIHTNWKSACKAAYGGGGYCYLNCEANVDFFHYMLATADAAPFTEAQTKSSANMSWANQQINSYNDAKTRYDYLSTEYPLMNKPQPSWYTPKKLISTMPVVKMTPVSVFTGLLF
jgi:hypothetical protein